MSNENRFVIVDTDRGFEVWPNASGSELTAIFRLQSDVDLFVTYASKSDVDRIRNAAFEIASSFPALNYSRAPINPNGELVMRIAHIISQDFPVAHNEVADEGSDQILRLWYRVIFPKKG